MAKILVAEDDKDIRELIVLTLQFNGFDVKSVNDSYSTRGSLGMVNMRERAERVDGSLRVESAPGKGTAVTLVVPIDKKRAGAGVGRAKARV